MQTRPKKGQGERFLECRYYDDCLDLAALRNWKSFNCEACDFYRLIFTQKKTQEIEKQMPHTIEKTENLKLCEECGERPTIHPNSRLCARCLGKRAWKDKDKNNGRERPNDSKGTQDKVHFEKSPQNGSTALTIEFGNHISVLRDIEKLAEEDLRPINLQVIYVLKRYLDTRKVNEAAR